MQWRATVTSTAPSSASLPSRERSAQRGPLLTSANPGMARTLQLVAGVAITPATVLLTGESGTGKEVLARHIHQLSPRARGAFVALNCGAVPANLVESELFGHERGAFSGATERRIGRFEAAHQGTLLLDEISEMPLQLQTRLLRVLQEREIVRVGGSAPIPVDVRIVATSNRDLRRMVREGTFREDLYYRINVFPVHVPPLRDRMEDLYKLVDTMTAGLALRFGRVAPAVTPAALARLGGWSWPGNVRELGNVLERALIIAPGSLIGPEHVILDSDVPSPEPYRPSPTGASMAAPHPMGGSATAVSSEAYGGGQLADLEQDMILRTLAAHCGNRTHAAAQLGISIRTLRNRLRDYRARGVTVPPPGRGLGSPAPAPEVQSCR